MGSRLGRGQGGRGGGQSDLRKGHVACPCGYIFPVSPINVRRSTPIQSVSRWSMLGVVISVISVTLPLLLRQRGVTMALDTLKSTRRHGYFGDRDIGHKRIVTWDMTR